MKLLERKTGKKYVGNISTVQKNSTWYEIFTYYDYDYGKWKTVYLNDDYGNALYIPA